MSKASSRGTWLADLCAREEIPCVLGPALSMKALPGGTAKNDTLDAQKSAVLLRGGRLPQASVYPAERRATRDLLRRRRPLRRQRAELLGHIHNTHRQDHLPEMGKKIAYQANRDGVAERLVAPAVQQSSEVDLARIDHDDRRLRAMELTILTTAKPHEANTLDLLRTVPGIGEILSLVLLDDMHDMQRFPRVHDCVSSCRLVKWAKASAGKRSGTSGTTIGKAYLTWAFSAAAVLLLRNKPAGHKSLARFKKTHGQGQALTVLAHQRARAVYSMGKRGVVFDPNAFLQSEGRRGGEPAASRGPEGRAGPLCAARLHSWRRRTLISTEALGPDPVRVIGRLRPLLA